MVFKKQDLPLDTFPHCNVDLTGSFGSDLKRKEKKNRKKKKIKGLQCLQIRMDVLVSQHFVGDPVEDVEYEEAQRKHGSGYGVDALGAVHKALVQHLAVVHGDRRRRRREHGGALHRRAVLGLQAVAQSVAPEVKAAALPHQLLLLWSQA